MKYHKIKNSELNRIGIDEYKMADKMPLVLVLDNLRSAHNIGSVFRSSDGLRVKKIHLCGITAQPPKPEIHKTALGATESVDWLYFKNTTESITNLRELGYSIFALEQVTDSIPLNKFDIEKLDLPIAIVIGNEVDGVQQEIIELCDGSIEIPQFGTKHSFNVSVSAAMFLWDFFVKWERLISKS